MTRFFAPSTARHMTLLIISGLLSVLFLILGASPRLMPRPPGTARAQPRSEASARVESPPRTAALGPSPVCLPGQRLVRNLADDLGTAEIEHPDLAASHRRLRGFWRMNPDPYSELAGASGLLRLMVGFARPDVPGYLKGRSPVKTPTDPGPGQGVNRAQLALFMPVESRFTFPVTLPEARSAPKKAGERGRYLLSAELGVIPSGPRGPVTFILEAFGPNERAETLLERKVEQNQRGLWFPVEADITRFAQKPFRIRLSTTGPAMAGAVVARPEIREEKGCRAGHNILLIIIDTLRADGVGAISGRKNTTPVLDRLASSGALFTRCFSLGTWTRPSMTAMLSSDLASALGLPRVAFKIQPEQRKEIYRRLRGRLITSHLDRLGYHTAAIGNNFFFLGHSSIGLDRGFGQVIDIRHPKLDSPAIAHAVSVFAKNNAQRPFFLWVHLDGPHWPYDPPRGYAVAGARAPGAPHDRQFEKYLGEARWADEHVGKILSALSTNGLDRNTLVAVTADHGEIFSDAHTYDMSGHITRHRHGWSIYDEVLHVPLIISGPGVGSKKIEAPVSHLDLMPTLVDLAGLHPMPLARGRSLAPWMKAGSGGPLPPRAQAHVEELPVVAEGRRQEAVRFKGLKYIRRQGFAANFRYRGRSFHVTEELYDIEADPHETRNLIKERGKDAIRLKELLERLLDPDKAKREGTKGPGKPPAQSSSDDSRPNAALAPLGTGAFLQGAILHFRLLNPGSSSSSSRLEVNIDAGRPPKVTSLFKATTSHQVKAGRNLLTIVLDSSPGRRSEAAVAIPHGNVTLAMRLDGKPLDPGKVLAGPFGLQYLSFYSPLNSEILKLLSTRNAPVLEAQVARPAVALWASAGGHSTTGSGDSGSLDLPGGAPDGQVDQLLRGWGYIKGKKKTKSSGKP